MCTAEASTSVLPLSFSVSHAGKTTAFSLPPATVLAELRMTLYTTFHVPPTAQKLILKGKQLITDASPISSLFPPHSKLLLVGPVSSDLAALQAADDLRRRKAAAYSYHALHRPSLRKTGQGTVEGPKYTFLKIVPFPPSVPVMEKRERMLKRLVEDPAIIDVMKRHEFVVGTLTELHPITQASILGLNKNAGEEISLRLLTDDLEGTRLYREVRKVLLHELAHNVFGPHDNDFNELNSLLNKEVAAYELSNGTGDGSVDVWSPSLADEIKRTTHTLSEVAEPGSGRVRMGMTDMDAVDERRERVGRAAEARRRDEDA